jgi:hypothetical protein
MEEHLIYYLIDEGYANTESSAFKILSVISEEFYEYLLNEVLTPEEKAAGRARTARRRAQLGIPEPSVERTAQIMGNIRQRGTPSAGGRPSSTSMRTSTGTSLPETGRRQPLRREAQVERQADVILSQDRTTRRGRESEQTRPTASPTFRNAEGKPQELNVTAHSGQSFTMIDPKSVIGKPSVQTTNWTRRDVGVGPNASREGSSVYSDKIPNPTRRTQKKTQ